MIDRQCEEPEYSPEELKAMAEQDEAEEQYRHEIETRFQRHGFVAFLDLLGYSQIAATDDAEIISIVMNTIQRAKESAKQRLLEEDHRDNGQPTAFWAASLYADIRVTFISDSIIIHQDLAGDDILSGLPEDRDAALCFDTYWFIRFVREVYSELLRKQLPSRCGIAYGNYFWNCEKESLLAGSALIEAHRVSESLPFTGTVLCDSITTGLADALAKADECCLLNAYLVRDLQLRLRDNLFFKGTVVRPNLTDEDVGDIEAFVKNQYTSFGKRIANDAVQYKLEKTVELFKILYPSS